MTAALIKAGADINVNSVSLLRVLFCFFSYEKLMVYKFCGILQFFIFLYIFYFFSDFFVNISVIVCM